VEEGLLRRCHNSQKAQKGVKRQLFYCSVILGLYVYVSLCTHFVIFQNYPENDVITGTLKYKCHWKY
jgi:hypothetical protein